MVDEPPGGQPESLQPMTSARLLVATSNPGKVMEYRELLGELGLDVEGMELHPEVQLPEEKGSTYQENAELKALTAARSSGLVTLADDSGLGVDALDGRPGVHSARFGGAGKDDPGRCLHLLERMEGLPPGRRGATFTCVISVATPQGEVRSVCGEVRGRILDRPRGEGGFGYDPLFLLPELGQTFAELDRKQKNRLSHRGLAVARLRGLLQGWHE